MPEIIEFPLHCAGTKRNPHVTVQEEKHQLNTPDPTAQYSIRRRIDASAQPRVMAIHRTIKDGIVALSMANWVFIRVWSNLLSSKGRFFSKLPVVRWWPNSLRLAEIASSESRWSQFGWGLTALAAANSCGPGFLRKAFLDIAFHGAIDLSLVITSQGRQFDLNGVEPITFARQPGGFGLSALVIAGLIVWKHTQVARWVAS